MIVRYVGRLGRLVSAVPPPLVPLRRALRPLIRTQVDVNFGGRFYVKGTTKITGTPQTPVRVKVLLHDQLTGLLVRSQWSDPLTGEYVFKLIKKAEYYVVAFDHMKNYRAVIADQLVPEPMA